MKNIVIIDDEVEIAFMIEKFLSKSGNYHVKTFHNPLVALESIQDDVDVVLLDIMMPQMGGMEVLQKLKEKYPKMHIIMMTAYSTLDKVLDSHRHGAVHYLMKPFKSLGEISAKIEEITT